MKTLSSRRKYTFRYCTECGIKLSGKNTTQFCSSNPDCMKKHMAERYKADVIRGSTLNAKRRARNAGVPFDLTRDDIPPIPEFCPALGIHLRVNTGSSGFSPNSPSLDRIIPELGYVKGNVQWLSNQANTMKSNATPDELLLFAKWIMAERL